MSGTRPTEKRDLRPRCTKGSCPNESAEDSVRCPEHRDEQRRKNEAYAAKIGKPVKPKAAQAAQDKKPDMVVPGAKVTQYTPIAALETNGHVEASWDAWKAGLIQQLAAAEEKLILKLTNVQSAKASIEAL